MDATRDEIRLDTGKVDRARVMILVVVMIVTGLLPLVGGPLAIDEGNTSAELIDNVIADRGRFFASNMLFGLFAALLGVSGIGFMLLARARAAVLMSIGGVLMVLGGVLLAAAVTGWATFMYISTTPGVGRATAIELDRASDNVSALAYLPWIIGGPALLLGIVLVAIALIVARSVPLWIPLVWVAGIALFMFTPPAIGLLAVLVGLPFAAAMIGAALALPKAVRGGTRATIRLPAQSPRHADEAARAEQTGT